MPPTRDASLKPLGRGRPVGRHISEITREIARAAGSNVDSIEDEPEWLRAQVGFLWERALEYMVQGFSHEEAMEIVWGELLQETRPVDKQIRLKYDGIYLTPDGRHRDENLLEEYKWTWKSASKWGLLPGHVGMPAQYPEQQDPMKWAKVLSKADPEKYFVEWIVRSAAYLKAWNETLNSRPVLQVRFIIFWAMGDYSYQKGRGPQPTQCIVTYTPEELDEGWKVVKRYEAWIGEQEKAAKEGA